MTIYERLGVPTIINALGPSTRVSGGLMRPEVSAAMAEASQHCVEMTRLQARASEVIAEVTGAEAGYVTSGAASALMLATAACMTGLDPSRMNRLPETSTMPNEVLMARSQRNLYDRALRQAGAKLVEIGIPDRYSGAGVRDAEPWEFEAAIGPQTAALFWVAEPHSLPPLDDMVRVAHAHDLPVIVDAAGQLPPASNLHRFVDAGADLVAISGGKAVGGPQASGILAGRRDLVQAAALQNLDQDELFALWDPPDSLFDKHRLPGLPHHGIGRVAKVGKEEIVGLLTALRLYAEETDAARAARWHGLCDAITSGLGPLPHAAVRTIPDGHGRGLWLVELAIDEAALGRSALDVASQLQSGTPAIFASTARASEGVLLFAPMCLKPEHPPAIAARLTELLG